MTSRGGKFFRFLAIIGLPAVTQTGCVVGSINSSRGSAPCGASASGSSESRQCFAADYVPFGETCQSTTQSRTCDNGAWNPDYSSCDHLSCFVSQPGASGICGSANGGTFSSAPTTNLCSAGTPTSVTGTGPWSWQCTGANGSTTASCSAVALTGSSISYTGPTSISGISALTGDVSQLTQPPRIVAVTWKLDGVAIGSDTTSPYSFDANAALLPGGSHSMTIEAVDEDGGRVESASVSVAVGAGPTPTSTNPSATNAIVHLASGTHSGFTVGSGTRVYGDGTGSVVNGNVDLSTNSRLENLSVNGTISGASGARVQKVTLTSSGTANGIDPGRTVELSIQDSTLIGPSATGSAKGISSFNDDDMHDLSVIRCNISNYGGDGIGVYGNADGSQARDVVLDNIISNANGPYDDGTQARDILLGGDQAVIINNRCDGATTDNIEPYGTASRMRINHNRVTNSPVGFYLEHFTTNSIFADNIVGAGVQTGFNIEWLAGDVTTSHDDQLVRNDVTYTQDGIFADAGTTGIEVGSGNILRGPLPAVTYQGSTNGSIHDNKACTTDTGSFASVYANDGFDPTGNVTQTNNQIVAPSSCPPAP